jgi:hypothetical protein
MRRVTVRWDTAILVAGGLAVALPAAASTPAPPDSMTLKGGDQGTVFDDLTIHGEDKIRIEFDRPPLDLTIDPGSAPGLTWDRSLEVLDRNAPSATFPLLSRSAGEESPYLAHPYFSVLATGPVARFSPKVEGVERWKLNVADSRGETVAVFEGKGKPPQTLTWDGMTQGGKPALPGLVYSYVFEAFDKAGNKRNFMGDGFEVRPYLRRTPTSALILFTGADLTSPAGTGAASQPDPPILVETAGWLNQLPSPTAPIRVEARARSFDQAKSLADRVAAGLTPLLLGDSTRLAEVTTVQPDAPEGGAVLIQTAP